MKSNLPELVHAPWRSHRAKRKNVHWCNARSEKFQRQNRRWCRCALLTARVMLMSGGTAFCCFHFLGSFKTARLLISSCYFRSSSSPSCKPVCCSIDMKTQILIFWASQYESKSVCFSVMSSSSSFAKSAIPTLFSIEWKFISWLNSTTQQLRTTQEDVLLLPKRRKQDTLNLWRTLKPARSLALIRAAIVCFCCCCCCIKPSVLGVSQQPKITSGCRNSRIKQVSDHHMQLGFQREGSCRYHADCQEPKRDRIRERMRKRNSCRNLLG